MSADIDAMNKAHRRMPHMARCAATGHHWPCEQRILLDAYLYLEHRNAELATQAAALVNSWWEVRQFLDNDAWERLAHLLVNSPQRGAARERR